jgi:hypothetical protein
MDAVRKGTHAAAALLQLTGGKQLVVGAADIVQREASSAAALLVLGKEALRSAAAGSDEPSTSCGTQPATPSAAAEVGVAQPATGNTAVAADSELLPAAAPARLPADCGIRLYTTSGCIKRCSYNSRQAPKRPAGAMTQPAKRRCGGEVAKRLATEQASKADVPAKRQRGSALAEIEGECRVKPHASRLATMSSMSSWGSPHDVWFKASRIVTSCMSCCFVQLPCSGPPAADSPVAVRLACKPHEAAIRTA